MQVTIEGKELVIRIPVENPPRPSKSGKSLIVASTNGNQPTNLTVDGKVVTVGLNVYVSAT